MLTVIQGGKAKEPPPVDPKLELVYHKQIRKTAERLIVLHGVDPDLAPLMAARIVRDGWMRRRQ